MEYSDDAAGFVFCAVIFHASSFSYQNDFMMAEGRFSESGKREGSDTAGGSPVHSIHISRGISPFATPRAFNLWDLPRLR